MSESEKPFSVSDRRHFTPEGRPRDEDEEQAAAPAASPASDAPPASAAAASDAAAAEEPPERAPRPSGPVDFSSFLLSLGAQAGLLLSGGGEPSAEGMDEASALDGARQIIGILEMLEDKTQGRRSEEETRVLDGLLFQLRMAYVERSRARKP